MEKELKKLIAKVDKIKAKKLTNEEKELLFKLQFAVEAKLKDRKIWGYIDFGHVTKPIYD